MGLNIGVNIGFNIAKSKMAARGPKMADWVWKVVYPYIFRRSHQLLLIKFFNPSTLSMRKGRNGGEKKCGGGNGGENENNDGNSSH